MCWIALFTAGKNLNKEKLQNAWDENNDGGGFMYAENKKLFVEKGFVDFESFYEAYSKVDINISRVIHFRKVSSGKENAENCHPFYVNDGLAFCHNGTIFGIKDYLNDAEKDFSDTYLFNEKILKPLVKNNCNIILIPNNLNILDFNLSKEQIKEKINFGQKYARKFYLNFIKNKKRRKSI
jgi:predicted glutamine amidotransferase